MKSDNYRVDKQADILVNQCIKVRKADKVLIVSDLAGLPLVLAVYKLLIVKGVGEIRVQFNVEEMEEIYFKYSGFSQRQFFPSIAYHEIKNVDCFVRIYAPENTRHLSNINPALISQRVRVTEPISAWRVEKTRWVTTVFPTQALAQEADMSLNDYRDFVFDSMIKVNWKKLKNDQDKLVKLIDKTSQVRIVGQGTDLTLFVKGRKAENAGGEMNMPDGEVFTSVVEDSVEGFITFSYPALNFGREFTGVKLEFKKGKVIKAICDKNEKDFNRILDMDKGARFLGELGFGNNYRITKFTKDILFDEKIGGSIHLALGRGYKETLSKNKSALHWDLICDLRVGGKIWFDGKLVQANGVWLV